MFQQMISVFNRINLYTIFACHCGEPRLRVERGGSVASPFPLLGFEISRPEWRRQMSLHLESLFSSPGVPPMPVRSQYNSVANYAPLFMSLHIEATPRGCVESFGERS